MLEIGAAKGDITTWHPELGMMGWGMLGNVARGAATPLHARAYVLRAAGRVAAIACCELAFISLALKEAVVGMVAVELPELGVDETNLLLTATHTHSGPGGFTHYPFYNVTIPGFAPDVLAGLARRITDTIVAAAAAMRPGALRYAEAELPPTAEAAFNRAVPSYNRNRDVEPVPVDAPERAIDRVLRLVRFDAANDRAIGSINWFAVHCTSIHSDNTALHFDNKGYAAQFVELAGDGVAAFAQGACGDVTPNHWRHPGRPFLRGRYADDDASARYCGQAQADAARVALARAQTSRALPPRIASAHAFVDFSRVEVDPRFVGGRTGVRTSPAEIGVAMFFGTEEGPGLPRRLRFVQELVRAVRPWRRLLRSGDPARDAAQAEKVALVETGRRRILGLSRLRRLPMPWRLHRALELVRELDRAESDANPWTPQVLPVQLLVLGDLALVAVPAEFTTVAGRRLCAGVEADLAPFGVRKAILAGYSNAYAGYVTTPEEYEAQDYEGASTHFGKWTLPAYQTAVSRLCAKLIAGHDRPEADEPRPPVFSPRELATRAFLR